MLGRARELDPAVGRVEVRAELEQETRLPDPRLPGDQHDLAFAVLPLVEALEQLTPLRLAPHEERAPGREPPPGAAAVGAAGAAPMPSRYAR